MSSLVIDGRRLEYRVLNPSGADPCVVFLHEGLGSADLWRGFPAEVTERAGNRGIVYSRYGHGWSDPPEAPRSPTFMQEEATVLESLLEDLSVSRPLLVGHSDGASIAIIHAGRGHPVSGLVLIAPHVFVEPVGLQAIEAARHRFATTDMGERMAKYHHDPEATFRGWNDVWLHPGFRGWNIESSLPGIRCPVLVIQGRDDEYGTEAQVEAVARSVSGPAETLILDGCGHSPHLARPEETVAATAAFVRRVSEIR